MTKFIHVALQRISVWNIILSKLQHLEHMKILQPLDFGYPVEGQIQISKFQ